jgi:hypothetical protein
MIRNFRTRWILALAVILAWHEAPVHAYIDPGTGSMMLQGVIAAVTSAAIVIRLSWARIRALFKGKPDDRE